MSLDWRNHQPNSLKRYWSSYWLVKFGACIEKTSFWRDQSLSETLAQSYCQKRSPKFCSLWLEPHWTGSFHFQKSKVVINLGETLQIQKRPRQNFLNSEKKTAAVSDVDFSWQPYDLFLRPRPTFLESINFSFYNSMKTALITRFHQH